MLTPATRSISILDVAKTAQVGVGTVSRVINNQPGVSAAASAAVRKAMALLDYTPPPSGNRRGPRPNSRKKQPASQADITLIILARYGLHWILHQAPVYASVLHGIQASTTEEGGDLSIRQAANWDQLNAAIQQSKGNGCIILGEKPPGPFPPSFRFNSAVWVMGSLDHPECDHVQPDHMRLGQIAAEYFAARGHKHVAYIGGPLSPVNHVSLRGSAYQWWTHELGLQTEMLLNKNLVISHSKDNRGNEEELAQLVDRLLALSPRPTAVMLEADLLAPQLYALLEARGVRPQVDLEVLTCNNEPPYLAHLNPRPVVLDLQAEAIGRRAVEQVKWRLSHPTEPAVRTMVQPILLPGGSPEDFPGTASPASSLES